MSLTEEDVNMIVTAITPIITEPLRDVATSHQLAIQMVKDALSQLEECKTRLDAMKTEMSRATHHEVDAETSIGIHKDLAEIYKKRAADLEVRLEEKQAEIVKLRLLLNGRVE